MKLSIPTKCESEINTLKDAMRILCWNHYKETNGLKGEDALNGYNEFSELWKKHEIQTMDLPQLYEFIESLGWTVDDVLEQRREYYQKKASYKSTSSVSQSISDKIGF
jgi:adenylate cyclase class IV